MFENVNCLLQPLFEDLGPQCALEISSTDMILKLDSIHDAISEDTLRALKAVIQVEKKPKMPSTAARIIFHSSAGPGDQFLFNTFEIAYKNCDWAFCSDIANELDYDSEEHSELTRLRTIVSLALGKTYNESSNVLSRLIEYINIYTAFGDLYIALAGLKLTQCQIDSAARLLEISALCTHNHSSAYELMKDKIDRLLPICTCCS